MNAYSTDKIHFVTSGTPEAEAAREALTARYGACAREDAEMIVALGGDGLMLETLHSVMDTEVPVFGMNFGSVGFLMNEFAPEGLTGRLKAAEKATIHPLAMKATDRQGDTHHALALNEVSLFRASFQAAKIEILIDGKTRMHELVCDGVLVSTPAGSTAYNLSAHGPILPIDAPLLALTPISPFRPRRWRGAIVSNSAQLGFHVIEPGKRPIHAAADNVEFKHVVEVEVREDRTHSVNLLFDPGHSLDERVLNEQFRY